MLLAAQCGPGYSPEPDLFSALLIATAATLRDHVADSQSWRRWLSSKNALALMQRLIVHRMLI